jgi:alpha/beta superfamily hydrolase
MPPKGYRNGNAWNQSKQWQRQLKWSGASMTKVVWVLLGSDFFAGKVSLVDSLIKSFLEKVASVSHL